MNPGVIRTFTGRSVDVFALRPEDVDLVDIAHALSQVCRWSGHTVVPYSVAQHSVLVADRVFVLTGSYLQAIYGLLHDASEAYLGDMAAPLKRTAWAQGYRELEARVTATIALRFGLPAAMPDVIHHVDLELLATEARDLMDGTPDLDADVPPALAQPILAWPAFLASQHFLDRFDRFHRLLGVQAQIRTRGPVPPLTEHGAHPQ